MKKSQLLIAATLSTVLLNTNSYAHNKHSGHIQASSSSAIATEFDIARSTLLRYVSKYKKKLEDTQV